MLEFISPLSPFSKQNTSYRMKAEITVSCISFQQCSRPYDSPDVNGKTENPRARLCCGPPAPPDTGGSERLQFHLSVLCFTSPWVIANTPWVIPPHTHSHRATSRPSCVKSTPRRCSGPSGAVLLPVPGPRCSRLVLPLGCCLVLNWGSTSPVLGPSCSVLCFSLLLNVWLQALLTVCQPSPVLKC